MDCPSFCSVLSRCSYRGSHSVPREVGSRGQPFGAAIARGSVPPKPATPVGTPSGIYQEARVSIAEQLAAPPRRCAAALRLAAMPDDERALAEAALTNDASSAAHRSTEQIARPCAQVATRSPRPR